MHSVLTPYYSEETVYSKSDLEMENEDGVSIIYYLQKIYPGRVVLWTPIVQYHVWFAFVLNERMNDVINSVAICIVIRWME